MRNVDSSDAPHNWRLPAMVVVAAIVFVVGERIPIAGLDPSAVADCMMSSPGCLQRVSIFALGLVPLLNVLILYEMLKLAGVPLETASNRHPRRLWLRRAIVALSLLIAAAQGIGIHQALTVSGFVGEDPLSTVTTVLSLVAGVALLVFLAELIRLPDLVLGGFWLILTLPVAGDVVAEFPRFFDLVRSGAIEVAQFVVVWGLVIAGVALIVFAATALQHRVVAAGGTPARWSSVLVWPPFVAASLANLVAGQVYGVVLNAANPIFWQVNLAWIVTFVLVLPIVVLLYARSISRTFPEEPDWKGKRGIFGLIMLIQAAISIGFLLAPDFSPIFLGSGSAFIALVTVLWALWRSLFRHRI